jgi:ATP-dependent Lon protease
VAGVDYHEFLNARAQFSSDEWMDVLMQSVGFNPEPFTRRGKLLTLIRLIPFCERNYNLLEFGPKGTSQSNVYAEFSPHGMLISGSEVTAPKLFVSNANGKIGLVGLLGRHLLRRIRRQGQEGRQDAGRHQEELHGQPHLLAGH